MRNGKTRVLLVGKSVAAQWILSDIVNSDSHLEVAGMATNGREALEFLSERSADVVLMDLQSKDKEGLDATRRIMENRPLPVVICSDVGRTQDSITAIRLLEAGAVACVNIRFDDDHADFEAMASNLTQTLQLMSEVKVVRRWASGRYKTPILPPTPPSPPGYRSEKIEIVGIGGSTGGPPVLQTILASLPENFSVPVLIVQHISPGFVESLATWLNQTTGRVVHVASQGMQAIPGHVYLAPDSFHMAIHRGGQISLDPEGLRSGMRPSVAHLFGSLADVYGPRAIGVLLTGMGKDGAAELRKMKDKGAFTIVQDKESSVVFGMPGEAVAIGAHTCVLPASRIATAIVALVNRPLIPEGSL